MAIDLNKMSLKELRDHQTKVGKAISEFEDKRKKDALSELEDRAKSMGFSLSDLMSGAPSKKRSAAVAKYANPENKSDTWSGRGRKPRWFTEALDNGMTPDQMAI